MTLAELQLAAHQIGMYRASRRPERRAEWHRHQRAADALRARVGVVYAPYRYANRALVKATHDSLRDGLITRADFACVLACVRGEWRDG